MMGRTQAWAAAAMMVALATPASVAAKIDKTAVPAPSNLSADELAALPADPVERLASMATRLSEVDAARKQSWAEALIDHVAAEFDALPEAQRGRAERRLWTVIGGADGASADIARALVERMRGHALRFRAAGAAPAELEFLDWMMRGLPSDARLGQVRTIHRRAAETGRLASTPAVRARSALALLGRALNDDGHADEVVRALDDSFAELDAAKMRAVDLELMRVYAETLTLVRRDADADRLFDELIALWSAQPPSSQRDRAIQLAQNQASYYRNIVRRFDAAEAPGRYAADKAVELLGRSNIATQKARYNYALSLLGQGKAATALPYFEEALPLQRAAEQGFFGNRTDTIILLTTLARARAQVPGQEAAGLDAAVEAAERLRRDRADRLGPTAKANPAVTALARAVARGNRRDPLGSAYDMVLFAGWAARRADADAIGPAFLAAQDLTLTDAGNAINDAAARAIAGSGPLGQLVRTRQDLAADIIRVNDSFRSESLGKDEATAAALRAELDSKARELAALDVRINRDFPEYATLVTPRAVAIADVRAQLADDEAVLMLLPSEGHHYIFAVSQKAVTWHRVDEGARDVAALVSRLKCRIDEATCSVGEYNALLEAEGRGEPSVIDARYPRYDRAAAHRLYQMLIAPVRDALPEGGRIYTVASGPIAGLPLATLVADVPLGDAESGQAADLAVTDWLSRHYRFITLPSVSALTLPAAREQRRGAAARPALVAYGAPVLLGNAAAGTRGGTGGSLRRRGGIGVRAAGLMLNQNDKTMAAVDKLRQLEPLPGTAQELTRLSALLAKGQGIRLGKDATETAVKRDRELPAAVTVVFATHGLLPGEMATGSEPGLVLTPPGTASLTDDGLLTASEAAALSLSARWVVLSACNTANPGAAIESNGGSESLSSLARSFLYAGADNLLASHWRVADDATAALTVEVLSPRDVTPATALAMAMEAVRTGRRADGSPVDGWQPHWAHPASWAPFTLVTNRDR